MCNRDSTKPVQPTIAAAISTAFPSKHGLLKMPSKDVQGSRRKRLWELPVHTHCPLIGVCLPMAVLRRLIGKALSNKIVATDYEFHVAAVAECSSRRPISEILQREMDRRFGIAVQAFAQAKTTIMLKQLWEDAMKSGDVAGALWATLTHPRCDESLQEQVCHDIHMFQHQVGACNRADLQQLEKLKDENVTLAEELALAKERHIRSLAERGENIAALNSQLMRMRAELIAKESSLDALRAELQALREMIPTLLSRTELARKNSEQQQRIQELMHERLRWQQQAEQEHARAAGLAARLASIEKSGNDSQPSPGTEPLNEGPALHDKAVLCVGGRQANVPAYRQLIEKIGGRFLHHDGGEEQSSAQLEANLAAADLVICQAGCISHNAYWRVKDYCKRTGKRCIFVDKPSTSTLVRCLNQLSSSNGQENKAELT